ncbi:hypothetical protein JYU34_020038 [Plutella xylostella]|uniref:Uncharacterized protein n=1 Tax=Plutella xylostella TaxID=51655 RepID=A0ABQ7PW28_PLUXY|nr:hypothetical protein JYU34_020038 [Plutella xylostella]
MMSLSRAVTVHSELGTAHSSYQSGHNSETPPPHPRAPASPAHPPHPPHPPHPAGAAGAGPAACNFRRHFRGTKEISVWDAAAAAAALCILSTVQKSKLFLIFS